MAHTPTSLFPLPCPSRSLCFFSQTACSRHRTQKTTGIVGGGMDVFEAETTPPLTGASTHVVSPALLFSQVDNLAHLPLPACLKLVRPPAAGGNRENELPDSANSGLLTRRTSRERPRPAYDVLLEKGRIAEEKRELMVQDAIARELSTLRAVPNLNRTSSAARRKRFAAPEKSAEGRIEDRLLQRAKVREAQRQEQAKAREDKLEAQLALVATFRPQISKRAQSTKPKVYAPPPDREAWRQAKKAELEQALERSEREVRGAEPFRPAVDKQSERLAHRAHARHGLDGCDVADRIWAREARRRSEQWARLEASDSHATGGKPTITARAAALVRPGSPGKRLYEATFDMAERRWAREAAQASADRDGGSFAPRITKSGAVAAPRYLDPTWANDAARARAQATSHSFHPSIDPVSAILAQEMGESPWERLYASTSAAGSDTEATYSNFYRPPVRPLSPRAAAALDEDRQRRQLWYQQRREEQEERETQECTFQPHTHSSRRERRISAHTPRTADEATVERLSTPHFTHPAGVEAVAERSRAWEDRRQQRLELLRSMAFSHSSDKAQPRGP